MDLTMKEYKLWKNLLVLAVETQFFAEFLVFFRTFLRGWSRRQTANIVRKQFFFFNRAKHHRKVQGRAEYNIGGAELITQDVITI